MRGFKAVDNDLRDFYFEGTPSQPSIPCKDSPGMKEIMEKPLNHQMNEDELEYLLYLKKKYVALSKELKQDIIRIRVEQAEQFIKRMDEVVSKTHEPKWEEYYLSDYLTERSKPEIQDFIKISKLLIQSDWYFELEDALFYGADLTGCKTNEEQKPWVDKILLRYREILEEALPEEAPESQSDARKTMQVAGKKRGEEKRNEKERRKKECYRLYDFKRKNTHHLHSEAKIKQEIAKEMHINPKTVTRYLLEREDNN